jgi:hypothetical protein
MKIITEKSENDHALGKEIRKFFKEQRIGQLLKSANAYKKNGVPVVLIFIYLLQPVFTKKSMYMNILNGSHAADFGKDVVYRFLNSTFINRTKFLLGLSSVVIAKIAALNNEDRTNVLIVDDSLFERGRSKKVELLAMVHDHATKSKNKFKRGFRMLTLGRSDGSTFIPLLFRLLSSADKTKRYNEADPDLDKRSVGHKIRKEAVSKATDILFSMLERAKKMHIPAKHVLFDSWFSYPGTMIRIHEIGFDVIGRLKDTRTIKYLYTGERKTLKQIYAASKKRRGRAKYLLSVEVLLYNGKEETLPARIVFVRDRNKSGKWIAFGSTDMTLSEEEIIRLYGKRRDIEVFFKMCKSYLNLAREFQGLSYDAMTAHTTIVMTRYILLAVQKRHNEDPRTLSELFYLCFDQIADIQFADALDLILRLIQEVLADCLLLTDEQMNEIIDAFIAKLSSSFRVSLSPLKAAG